MHLYLTDLRSNLDQSSDDPEGGESQVLEWPGLADGLQERVQVQRDVGGKELGARLGVGGHALQGKARGGKLLPYTKRRVLFLPEFVCMSVCLCVRLSVC